MATKESYFTFNGLLYKQIDGVAMGSPLGPSLADAFLSYHEKNQLSNCPQGLKPVFYSFLNFCHLNMSFSMETKKENKLAFLDVEVIPEQGKFTTTIYQKPTFSGVYKCVTSYWKEDQTIK